MKRFKIGKAFTEQLGYFDKTKSQRFSFSEDNFVSEDSVKLGIYYIIIFLLPFILLVRLFSLQILSGSYYKKISNENRIMEKSIPAPRGVILDRNGIVLARNIPFYRIFEGKDKYKVISRDEAINLEARGGSEAAKLILDTQREYEYPLETAHIIGYLGEAKDEDIKNNSYSLGDLIGQNGIEYSYESILKGRKGKDLLEVDSIGNPLIRLGRFDAKTGDTLKLSIDIDLQKIAYTALSDVVNNERSTAGRDVKGTVIVSDPNTGQILALVSFPSFNPNIFTQRLDVWGKDINQNEYKINEVLNDKNKPLFNRAVSGVYPPGSTFKIVVATAGLETGKINENTLIEDIGVIEIGLFKFPNWAFLKSGTKDGLINIVHAIKRSNDLFFYRLGELLGLSNIEIWAKKFGLGGKLGIDLTGEASGFIPSNEWKRKVIGDKWYLGDTYHLSIGQGYLLVTPLQVNVWTSVIANGGNLCTPKIALNKNVFMKNENENCKKVGISKKTIELIREGMKEACSEGGTGWPLFNFEVPSPRSKTPNKVQIACKTGTAEFGDPDNKTHAWFTSFAPFEKPEIVVTVLVEGGGEGSDVAAPIAKEIYKEWFGR